VTDARVIPGSEVDTRPTVASIPRSEELALARLLRSIALDVAAVVLAPGEPCPLCRRPCSGEKHLHAATCAIRRARRARNTIAQHDVAIARANANLTEPSAPKPVEQCGWCGKDAVAVDDDGDPACAGHAVGAATSGYAREAAE
jgi:hypothetical protein